MASTNACFFAVCTLLLCTLIKSIHGPLDRTLQWDFVKHIPLNSGDVDQCPQLCKTEPKCMSWTIEKSSNLFHPNYTPSGERFDCYLLSEDMVKIQQLLPVTISNKTHISGYKLSAKSGKLPKRELLDKEASGDVPIGVRDSHRDANVQFQRLLMGPLATDTSTLLNYPQHFVSHCAYTISMWVWIYRPRTELSETDRAEKVIFAAKEIHPKLAPLTTLLPSIIYNVAPHPGKFFFSMVRGAHDSDYLGFHRGEVRYHEWIHIAVTIHSDGTMSAYQDGTLLDTLKYGPRDIKPSPVQHCVYDHNMHTQTHKARASTTVSTLTVTNPPTSAAVSTSPSNTPSTRINKLFAKSASASYFDNIVHNPWDAYVNNSILYVAGRMHHRGIHNTIGMVHNLHIVRNSALTGAQIRRLMTHTLPPRMPALQKLLQMYNIPSLQGFTPIRLTDDFYRSWEWGLCPEIVCGKVCMNDHIYLDRYEKPVEMLRQSDHVGELFGFVEPVHLSPDNTTDQQQTLSSTDIPDAVHKREAKGGVVNGKTLQDIGHPSDTAVYRSTLLKTIRTKLNNSHWDTILPSKTEVLEEGMFSVFYDFILPVVLNPVESILFNLQYLLETAERLLYGLPLYSEDYLNDLAEAQAAAKRPLAQHNMTLYERYVYQQTVNTQYYTRTREGKVQGLYKRAMTILSDRYVVAADTSPTTNNNSTNASTLNQTNNPAENMSNSTSTSARISQDFNSWRAEQMESAHAALFLALWLAEDIPHKTDPDDVFWTFKTAHLLTQPIHLALGYSTGTVFSQDYVPWEEVQSMLLLPSAVLSEAGVVEEILGIEHHSHSQSVVVSSIETDVVEEGVFYIDHSTASSDHNTDVQSTDTESTAAAVSAEMPTITEKHSEYTFSIDENGEVVVVHHPVEATSTSVFAATTAAVATAPTVAKTGRDTPVEDLETHNWLKVFANLSTDNVTAELQNSLQPLAVQGLNASFLHNLIIAKQMREAEGVQREMTRRWRVQHGLPALDDDQMHGDALLKATQLRSEVDQQLVRCISATTAAAPAHTELASHTTQSVARGIHSPAGSPDCRAQASYYFPITQYVSAQYGSSHSGIGLLEEVRLMASGGAAPEGHAGEEDILHQHTEAEAHDGNPFAQTWLAKKYFWGLGGLQRNEMLARRWFERAAAQNDPEGLYNVGIFHNNGQAGLEQNPDLAMQYFHRAADHANPFPMALHAVGNHYMYGEQKNFTRAMSYLLKAAAHRSDDAHFSLAMLYREGKGTAVDIPRSVAHLAVAASWGHVRSLNFLAHALYDADSWLMQYGREQVAVRRRQAMQSVLARDDAVKAKQTNRSGGGGAGGTGVSTKQKTPAVESMAGKPDPQTSAQDPLNPNLNNGTANSTAKSHDEARVAFTDSLLKSSQVFNELELIKINLPDGTLVPLPYPLGSPEGSCEAVLPIMKYLSEMSYRPKDLVHRALKEYIAGDYWAALSLYEEAADLGVYAAQENAAYLLEKIMPAECAQYEEYLLKEGNADSQLSVSAVSGVPASTGAYQCTSPQDCCQQYLSKLATKRWAQLAKMGEPRAMRKVADALLDPKLSHMMLPSASGGDNNNTGDKSDTVRAIGDSAGSDNFSSSSSSAATSPALSARQQAAVLYSLAGDQGDSESLLQLGWMLYYGEQGVVRNQTAAKALFETALELEAPSTEYTEQEMLLDEESGALGDVYEGGFIRDDAMGGDGGGGAAVERDLHHAGFTDAEARDELQELSWQRHQHTRRWHTAGFASPTTQGVAPSLALAVVQADAFLQAMGFNTTVRELSERTEQLTAQYVPAFVQNWFHDKSGSKGAAAAARAGKRNNIWYRVKRVVRSGFLRLVNVLEDSNYNDLVIPVQTVLMIGAVGVMLHWLVHRNRRE